MQSFLFLNTPRLGAGIGQTPLSTSNILIDDLNNLNATNPGIAAALAFHSNLDPMLGINSPLKFSSYSSSSATAATNSAAANNTTTAELLVTPPLKDTTTTTTHNASLASSAVKTVTNALSSPISRALYGKFPIQFLLMITRLNKILAVKHDLVKKLAQMNSDAERLKVRIFVDV